MEKKGAKRVPEAKIAAVAEIKQKIEKAAGIALVDYRGLTVAQDTELRNDMRKNGIEYKVIKNNLIRRAFGDMGVSGMDAYLEGPTAVAFGYDDAVSAARISAQNIAKFGNKISLKAGYVEGKCLDAAEITALSKIPSKETLVAMLLGMLTMPIRSLAVTMSQIAEKKA